MYYTRLFLAGPLRDRINMMVMLFPIICEVFLLIFVKIQKYKMNKHGHQPEPEASNSTITKTGKAISA
jgi:heme/copper-type cytochrome/quinol oxidase subunit 2